MEMIILEATLVGTTEETCRALFWKGLLPFSESMHFAVLPATFIPVTILVLFYSITMRIAILVNPSFVTILFCHRATMGV